VYVCSCGGDDCLCGRVYVWVRVCNVCIYPLYVHLFFYIFIFLIA